LTPSSVEAAGAGAWAKALPPMAAISPAEPSRLIQVLVFIVLSLDNPETTALLSPRLSARGLAYR
jgi:hypothetical protein